MVRLMRHTVEPVLVGVVCTYEAAALIAHSEKLPTITTLVSRLPKFARRAIGSAAAVWLVYHFEAANFTGQSPG